MTILPSVDDQQLDLTEDVCFSPVTIDEVCLIVDNLNKNHSAGFDEISYKG